MQHLPDEYIDELKNQLKAILEGNGGSQNREEFLILQKYVQSRSDLTAKTLIKAHRSQLEILVAINMGIQAFLHPNMTAPVKYVPIGFAIFVFKRAAGPTEMLFRCRACNRPSELLGWVKDVFQHCAPAWVKEALMRT
ncbi:hypothetical protein F3Y22_tig00111582pilonHSYRG01370 [Hibiscus syriacus]|uniref:Oberon-like PHD finger domain-containing protein n=1 Tax=Hibiscus syriacus TaxID=106335 RepID=A0A6A2YDL9_HIBSY|nr:hypothetical protein F3Y22_tig00111582pilonHSYRG01370 [Hibiscus syriacus]